MLLAKKPLLQNQKYYNKEMRKTFSLNIYGLIFSIMLLVAACTWLLSAGEYDSLEKDGRTYTVAGSYHAVTPNPQGVGAVLTAPAKGFNGCAEIIVFIFITGAIFTILERTGTVSAVIVGTSYFFSRREKWKKLFIPASMFLFSLGGAVFGMEEETLIFIPLFIPLALSLGYDTAVGVSIPFLGAWVGFGSAFMNPFTVGISQGIAGLPLYSGMGYRLLVWFICTSVVVAFVAYYGEKIRRTPQKSITFEDDEKRRRELQLGNIEKPNFKKAHLLISLIFAVGMGVLVCGVALWHWYIVEISGLFLAVGLISAVVGRLTLNQTTDAIIDGARSMVSVAVMLALARGVVVIASDGKILDTVLHGIVSVLGNLHPLAAVEGMFVAHSFINFFVASGSGQAVLTMPVMIPLSDLMHISPQLSILAYQFGEGWTNAIIPTAPVTMAAIGMAGISWSKWAKWNWPLQVILAVLSMLLLIPPFLMGW